MYYTEDVEGVKVRLGISDESQDALILQMLTDAESAILDYCNRTHLPDAAHGLLRELAVTYYNRMGAEGESSRSEGAISVSYSTEIPQILAQRLNRWRRASIANYAKQLREE